MMPYPCNMLDMWYVGYELLIYKYLLQVRLFIELTKRGI